MACPWQILVPWDTLGVSGGPISQGPTQNFSSHIFLGMYLQWSCNIPWWPFLLWILNLQNITPATGVLVSFLHCFECISISYQWKIIFQVVFQCPYTFESSKLSVIFDNISGWSFWSAFFTVRIFPYQINYKNVFM